jgi:hypothetical protein
MSRLRHATRLWWGSEREYPRTSLTLLGLGCDETDGLHALTFQRGELRLGSTDKIFYIDEIIFRFQLLILLEFSARYVSQSADV